MNEEKILKEEINKILVTPKHTGKGKIAHIPNPEPNKNNQTLCPDRSRHSKYLVKDPEAWKLWSWDSRRLCKRCKKKYLKQKEFLEKKTK